MTVRFHLETLLYAALVHRIGGRHRAPKVEAGRSDAPSMILQPHLNGRQFGVSLSGMALMPTAHGGVRLMGQMKLIDHELLALAETLGAATSYGIAVDSLLQGQTAVDLRFARMTLLPLSGHVAAFDAMEKEAAELGDLAAAIIADDTELQAAQPVFGDPRVSAGA